MIHKVAKTDVVINEIIAKRWSTRSFDANKKVSKTDILSLIEAARWAPSSMNAQPWRILIWDKFEDKISYDKAFSCVNEWNQKWAKNAPVLIGIFAADYFDGKDELNLWSKYDCGAAAMNILLQATSLGLATHPIGGFNADKLKQTFAIPSGFTPVSILVIGYQASEEQLEEPYKERELAARVRNDINKNFFLNNWGNPIK